MPVPWWRGGEGGGGRGRGREGCCWSTGWGGADVKREGGVLEGGGLMGEVFVRRGLSRGVGG